MKNVYITMVICTLFFSLWANNDLVRIFQDEDGNLICEGEVPGLPVEQRISGPIAIPTRSAVMIDGVPKFDWSYGCSATSAAMQAGYFDRNDFPYTYAGPTNNAIVPLNNATWGEGECPLSATHQGYDGLTTWGHVNRFWTGYQNSGDDPYGTSNPTGTYQKCTADYMGTNQDWWNCSDGSTWFYWNLNGSPLHDFTNCESYSTRHRDGCHGLRLFYESRGFSVLTNFTQLIYGYDGNTLGFTYDQYKQYINLHVPVLIHVQGHTMLGVGYDNASSTIYIHDTWDHNLHSMTWGGSYSGMAHYAVTIVQPDPSSVDSVLISGYVTNSAEVGIEDVLIEFDFDDGGSAATNSNGFYSKYVRYGWSGRATPTLSGHTFDPAYRDYSNVTSIQTNQNYSTVTELPAPSNLTLTVLDSFTNRLDWDAVSGAQSYYVYRSAEPYAIDWGLPVALTATTSYTDIHFLNKCFYKITASSLPPDTNESFIFVPGGTFTMGDTHGGGSSNELPTHSVTLSPYYIGKYEVTQAEYSQYMQPGSSWTSDYGLGGNYPAYYVSWYAILKYCNLRSMAEGLTPVYSISGSTNPANWGSVPTSNNSTWNSAICNWYANGYRLPTEAEWEYAARGRTNSPDYLYSGSNDINAVAWYYGNNSPYGSKPVGTKAPNGIGTYDMSGNLWEWCWDWYSSSYYSSSPQNNPTGPNSGSYRLLRGGYWFNNATHCRVAGRLVDYPYYGNYVGGFRLCRAVP